MKKVLVALILLAGMAMSGCGMVHSYEERERRYRTVCEIDARQFVDDWDYAILAHEPNPLTYWHVRRVD